MKENNSISKEIARVVLTVSAVSLAIALLVLAFVYYVFIACAFSVIWLNSFLSQ